MQKLKVVSETILNNKKGVIVEFDKEIEVKFNAFKIDGKIHKAHYIHEANDKT